MKSQAKIPFIAAYLVLLLTSVTIAAQPTTNPKPQSSLSGKYEGTVKDSTGEAKFTLDLVEEAGKFSGAITTSHGVFQVVKGQMVDGTLSLEFETKGAPHTLTVRQKGDMWVGTASDAGKTPAVEMRRARADEISGEWDAVADAQGRAFPFALILKVDGEKVTGSSSSQLGNSPISSGVWKEGKLALVLDGSSGAIGLVAAMVDGKLVGDYDFAGQLQGRWVAVRRK
jgi:hypothetical protein